jgi:hypothetical protein
MHVLVNARFIPALVIELNDLQASLITIRMRVVVPQQQVPLTGDCTRLPERLDGLVGNRRTELDEQDARQFSVRALSRSNSCRT